MDRLVRNTLCPHCPDRSPFGLVAFQGNVPMAVAAYYQGEGATRMFGILPVSEAYVANVMALRTRL